MHRLSFDMHQEQASDRPLRNLDEERGRFAPAIVMIALAPSRKFAPSSTFGRRPSQRPALTLH